MLNRLTLFAAEPPAADADLFSALGINWQLLIIQIIAFLILVFLLGKFVYPWLMKQVDERQANIEKAADAATQAQKAAAESQQETAALLAEARAEAADIVSTAKLEAAEMMTLSEKKAVEKAERIVAEASVQLEKDIATAKVALRDETMALVAEATAKVTRGAITPKADDALIRQALKERA